MTERADRPSDGITVRLRGGLGNQLFQYATGTAVADRLGCPLFMETVDLAAVLPADTPRTFELDWLVDPQHVLVGSKPGLSRRLLRRAARKASFLPGSRTFVEASFAFDPRIDEVPIGTTLDGYFQSWRYFASIADRLRSRLKTAAPRSPWRTAMEESLAALGPWVAVHVRRGDYLKAHNSAYHGLLGSAYYAAALAEVTRRGKDHRLVIFSDDPDAAVALIGPQSIPIEAVHHPSDVHPVESILLMSRAAAIVTANSSFSWWAGWLADPDRCTVVRIPML